MQGQTFQLIFGEEDQLSQLKVLMIGVGGIGCEVLKMISKFSFKEFHIIDMDTIEVSNLNRQFLFRREHRGKPKAEVAKQTMLTMAPQLNVIAHVDAVGVGFYRMDFLSQFDLIIMALDNQDTRSYVNKVCRALQIYLLDAGSMGFQGQSNQYYGQDQLYCYDCYPLSSTQKQYPACTIRQQPTNCIHCVIWAKYLFTQLFSGTEANEDSGILEVGNIGDPEDVFSRMFDTDIRLLKKELQYISVDEYLFLPLPPRSRVQVDGSKKFSVQQLISMWFYSFSTIQKQKKNQGDITFEKDEWIHTLFIYSSTCLRCINFKIEALDYAQVKTICGNIIHAIASTNSLVSALEISKMLQSIFFHEQRGASYVSRGKRERIVTIKQQKRNPQCNSCVGEQYKLTVDFAQITLGELVKTIRKDFKIVGELSVTEKSRIIWEDEDEDLVENLTDKKLSGLLDQEKDNRLLVSIEEGLVLVLWVIHKVEEVEIKIVKAFQNKQGFQIKLKQIETNHIKQIDRVRVEIQPEAKLISLSDSEEVPLTTNNNGVILIE